MNIYQGLYVKMLNSRPVPFNVDSLDKLSKYLGESKNSFAGLSYGYGNLWVKGIDPNHYMVYAIYLMGSPGSIGTIFSSDISQGAKILNIWSINEKEKKIIMNEFEQLQLQNPNSAFYKPITIDGKPAQASMTFATFEKRKSHDVLDKALVNEKPFVILSLVFIAVVTIYVLFLVFIYVILTIHLLSFLFNLYHYRSKFKGWRLFLISAGGPISWIFF